MVLSILICSPASTPPHRTASTFPFLYILLQIAERFYQTPLSPNIARGITKQPSPFAPWELRQFLAVA